jgi:hypothetical protein
MPSLSVICANVYADHLPIELLFKNLGEQTNKDFELVLVDAFYEENLNLVKMLSKAHGIDRVVHTPACEARHVGRTLHWELYNNAALFASGEWLLFHGVHRYIHHTLIQTVHNCAASNFCVVLFQLREDPDTPRAENLEAAYDMSIELHRHPFVQHSGFFSIRRDVLIEQVNGYNEVLVNDHWVDCDMGARLYHIPLDVYMIPRGLLRLERKGHYGIDLENNAFNMRKVWEGGKETCAWEDNPRCIRFLLDALREVRRIDGPVDRFVHDGFEWVQCDRCGTISVEDGAGYMDYLMKRGGTRAPINIRGIGRNLSLVAADLAGITDLQERISLVSSSHDNPKYLVP